MNEEKFRREDRQFFGGIFSVEQDRIGLRPRFGFGWGLAEPFFTEPVEKDVGQDQGPALLDDPLLRDGLEAGQEVADMRDGCDDEVALFVLHAGFDGALAAAARETSHSAQEAGRLVIAWR